MKAQVPDKYLEIINAIDKIMESDDQLLYYAKILKAMGVEKKDFYRYDKALGEVRKSLGYKMKRTRIKNPNGSGKIQVNVWVKEKEQNQWSS